MYAQQRVARAFPRALKLLHRRQITECPSHITSKVSVCASIPLDRRHFIQRSWLSDKSTVPTDENKAGDSPDGNSEGVIEMVGDTADPDEKESESQAAASGDDDGIDKSKFTEEVKIRMPDLGDAGEDMGSVEKWYKKEGDIIRRNDTLCDIHTELFTFGMVTDDECDAVMGEIFVPENSEPVEPGEVLCIVLHEDKESNADDK